MPKRKSAPPPPKHEAGAHVDRYVIEKLLGRGGMAEVYQAHDPRLKRKVALKVLHGDQKFYSQKRLLFEAQAAANFQHPNSVIIYDVGETGDDTFIAMELIRGRRLSEFVRDTTMPIGRKIRWLVSIARALAAAHRKGLVHRDIKPANVMIREEDNDAKVLDFGIARQVFPEGDLEGDITEEGQMVGT
ncbi:MAG: serine/threonine protein kinase, partial [Polyangiaceae bacterium]|nr:serine/threonine protein kinase [Polyangiaceae bacterium]